MKKLITLCMCVAMTAALHAATANWSVTKVYQPGTETAAAGYIGYLFEVSSSITIANVTSAINDGTFISTYASSALANGATTATGSLIKTGLGNYDASSGTVSWFTVLFDADSVAEANNYIVTDAVSQTFTSATGAKAASFTNIGTTYSWNTMAAVPEPTSGLLMLVGLAGLALRRRRA